MKKNSLRNLAVIILIIISLASYIYLNTTDINTAPQQSTQLEEDQQGEKEIMLPDVKAIKAVFEKGRRLLPAS